jgi:hypothetical protein
MSAREAPPLTTATTETARLTSDPIPPDVPLDVAYAVVATTPGGIRRIFEAKRRSYDKPSGMFGSWRLSREVHRMDERRHAMVRELVEEERIPFSVVAPFRTDHPRFAAVDPFVMQNSSKGGTLDMLINAGQFHDAIAEVPTSTRRCVRPPPSISTMANRNTRTRTGSFGDFSVIRVGHCFDRLKQAFAARFGITLRT